MSGHGESSETPGIVAQGEDRLIAERRAKLEAMRAEGESFPNDFRRDALAATLHEEAGGSSKEELQALSRQVKVAGRIMQRRIMGQASFIVLQDASGRIQCYLKASDLGPAYDGFRRYGDLGDIVGVTGVLMKTRTGELTVHAQQFRILAKALRPLPDKHKGLVDIESRYRRRYVDLVVNETSRNRFVVRAGIVESLRQWFLRRSFLEVETPVLHPLPGGAAARPFVTRHESLGLDMYLRIAPELYLKRLVVGGLERVFEFSRDFRNEGLSTRHNPEFTMLEFYQAYADYHDLMDETEDMLQKAAQEVLGSPEASWQGRTIDFSGPYERLTLLESLRRYTGHDEVQLSTLGDLRRIAGESGLAVEPGWSVGKLQMELFEARVEDRLDGPVFITGYPIEVSPLSRRDSRDPQYAERFELFIAGMEIANGFSELNDPEDQAQRFSRQMEARARGDEEAMSYDEDYVQALEYGMPPTAGEGIGIDRLAMLFTDAPAIRDVVLFPQMRPQGKT